MNTCPHLFLFVPLSNSFLFSFCLFLSSCPPVYCFSQSLLPLFILLCPHCLIRTPLSTYLPLADSPKAGSGHMEPLMGSLTGGWLEMWECTTATPPLHRVVERHFQLREIRGVRHCSSYPCPDGALRGKCVIDSTHCCMHICLLYVPVWVLCMHELKKYRCFLEVIAPWECFALTHC